MSEANTEIYTYQLRLGDKFFWIDKAGYNPIKIIAVFEAGYLFDNDGHIDWLSKYATYGDGSPRKVWRCADE